MAVAPCTTATHSFPAPSSAICIGPSVFAVVVTWAGAVIHVMVPAGALYVPPAAMVPSANWKAALASLAITIHIVLPITCMSK